MHLWVSGRVLRTPKTQVVCSAPLDFRYFAEHSEVSVRMLNVSWSRVVRSHPKPQVVCSAPIGLS